MVRLRPLRGLRRDSLRESQTRQPSRSSPEASEGWLGLRDAFRNWLLTVA
jgi:hypothetical protein